MWIWAVEHRINGKLLWFVTVLQVCKDILLLSGLRDRGPWLFNSLSGGSGGKSMLGVKLGGQMQNFATSIRYWLCSQWKSNSSRVTISINFFLSVGKGKKKKLLRGGIYKFLQTPVKPQKSGCPMKFPSLSFKWGHSLHAMKFAQFLELHTTT